mgnify:FL=1
MNIMFYSLIIFIIVYLLLKFIASSSTKRLSKIVRIAIFIFSIILAIVFAFGGRFLLSLPLILLSLGVIKLKGLTLYQLIGLFRLIQTLRNSGRFSFNQNQNYSKSSSLSLDEAYKILNLDKKTSRTIAIEVAMQNSGLASALAIKYFGAISAIPAAFYSVWHNISGSLIASFWKKSTK